MNILVDILALAICICVSYWYYKKGFFISLVNLCLFLTALYITKFLCLFLQNPIANLLTEHIPQDIPISIHTTLSNFGSTLPQVMAYLILLLVAFVFLAAFFLPIAKLINLLLKLPILKQMNRFLGAIFGLIIGALTAYFLLSLIWPTIQTVFFPNTMLQKTSESIVLSYIQQMISAILALIKII